jgi:hypothetical protein
MFNVDNRKYIGIKTGDGDVVYIERMVYGWLFIIGVVDRVGSSIASLLVRSTTVMGASLSSLGLGSSIATWPVVVEQS